MTLDEILAARRPLILRRWLDAILTLYPGETARFLKDEPDPFSNPVGQMMREAIADLYDRLQTARPPVTDACPPLERLMRLLAVQNTAASRAVGVLLALKGLVRAELTPQCDGPSLYQALVEVDERVDAITLLAFDLYVASREQLADLKVQESRRRTQKLLERLQGAGDERKDG